MTPQVHLAPACDADARRTTQRHFYEEECDPEFEVTRPRGCGRFYGFVIERKLRDGLDVLGLDLAGLRVLEVCCGSGMIAEALAARGAAVTGVDFSPAAVGRARERRRRFGFRADFLVGDGERLPFADRAFDVALVHDGLHHLEDPERALAEMARVAGRGVVVMEPAAAVLTALAVRVGLAQEVEDAGNRVHRLDGARVAARLAAAGFAHARWKRALVYYPHEPWPWLRLLDRPAPWLAFRAAYWLVDRTVGRFGNKLALGARRG